MSLVKKTKGFTLIELMIVVAIIGILAAVAIPKFADLVTKSKEASIKGSLGSVRSAISIYYGDNEGTNPSDGLLVTALCTNGKYMPVVGAGGLGEYTIPKTTVSGSGHDGGKVIAEGDVNYGAASDAAGTTPIRYSATTADVTINCTHLDTKGSAWSVF